MMMTAATSAPGGPQDVTLAPQRCSLPSSPCLNPVVQCLPLTRRAPPLFLVARPCHKLPRLVYIGSA